MNLDALLARPGPVLTAEDKDRALLAGLTELSAHHRAHCPEAARLAQVMGWPEAPASLAEVPWLPVGLFKSHRLMSVPEDAVFKTLTSSGTTGQAPSRVVLDRETARLQAKGLAATMTGLLGPKRLPMLVVDIEGLFSDPAGMSARGAGVLGMMSFGRDHLHVLDGEYRLRVDALRAWLERHRGSPFLLFGFTFLVWQYLVQQAEALDLDLSGGILVHSGGWKKLVDQAVDKPTFKARVRAATGIARVHDFYGMVEQVGSVFVEDEDGLLRTPPFAEVIVRDPTTWAPCAIGEVGVIEVLSLLPRSYPGHAILTEDLGVLHPPDPGPSRTPGTRFTVLGRAPRAEVRGCSDTHGGAA